MNELLEAIQFCYISSLILLILCIIFDKGPLTVKTLIIAILILAVPLINIMTYIFTFFQILSEYEEIKKVRDDYFNFIKKTGDLIIKILNYRLK